MSNLEVITAGTIDRFKEISGPAAAAYQIAFEGKPWREKSKCLSEGCPTGFCEHEPGSACGECGSSLVEAYDRLELTADWLAVLQEDNGMMELETDDDGQVLRVTIALPLTLRQLFERKYKDNPKLWQWFKEQLEAGDLKEEYFYILETFADHRRRASGNLAGRGDTLVAIGETLGQRHGRDLPILTRTIAPQIIKATLRDMAEVQVFVGTENSQTMQRLVNESGESDRPKQPSGLVIPDKRTLIAVNSLQRRPKA